ncbi:MAG: OmpA family protein [Nonomuraea sp.]|nr:OmpA family protein [Nonomuraea sp.]
MRTRTPMALASLALVVTGCGLLPGQPKAEAEQSSAPPPPATTAAASPSAPSGTPTTQAAALATTRSTMTPTFRLDVLGLYRIEGKHLLARLRVANEGQENLHWPSHLADSFRDGVEWDTVSGIGVLDGPARRWLMPYRTAEGTCVCSTKDSDGFSPFIKPGGDAVEIWAALPAPSGNPSTATIVTPDTPPLVDVPISDEQPPGEVPDLSGVTAVGHPISVPSESLDKAEETADDGKDLQVSLSSDVLFALNKATLTPRARAVLNRTAQLVDASADTTVEIAGHADSSGTDAINDPLSLRRAQAVRDALGKLVKRSDVRFGAKGYGSRKPLYSNDEEEGRRRNRRVTVTFAKPAPEASQPSSAPQVTVIPGKAGLKATTKVEGQPFALEVTGLKRLPGDVGILTYRITNQGEKETWHHELSRSTEWMSYRYIAASNLRLTDVSARRQYLPGRVQVPRDAKVDAYCACSEVSGVRLGTEKFGPDQTRDFWTLTALPPAAPSLSVKITTFPALQVPIS